MVIGTPAWYQAAKQPSWSSESLPQAIELVGGVVSATGALSISEKSSMVAEPVPTRPIPTERLVAPAGRAGALGAGGVDWAGGVLIRWAASASTVSESVRS